MSEPAIITVAFDTDGCLRNSQVDQTAKPIPNEAIRTLLIILAQFENIHIHVWSGVGELYARQVSDSFGISSYVKSYSSKMDGFQPDIAIDDVSTTSLGMFNLIYRQSKLCGFLT